MKRYYVFVYEAYYPGGGWTDFKGSFVDKDEAIAHADSLDGDYIGGIEVIDITTEQDIYIYKDKREVA